MFTLRPTGFPGRPLWQAVGLLCTNGPGLFGTAFQLIPGAPAALVN